ncbi:MAG: class I SAM-dependent methyltransferase [Myxococcota bacterium]
MNADHAEFLDRSYGPTHRVYDLTRKYYLLGRDTALDRLAASDWGTLVEVGSGTGRNLDLLRRRRPDARLGGVDASSVMRRHAVARLPGVSIVEGFAEDADLTAVLGVRPDRVLFSYCLSMVRDPDRALVNARRHLAPGGQVWVVDFGDLGGLGPAARALRGWLRWFRVEPLAEPLLARHGARLDFGPGRYWVLGRIAP